MNAQAEATDSVPHAVPLELSDARRVYDGAVPVNALDGVTLTIAAGEYVAITGRSGSGKSTLLNVIGLLDAITSGDYLINGVSALRLSAAQTDRLRAETFGFVFQAFYLLDYLTTAENVALGVTYQGRGGHEVHNEVDVLLDRVGLAARRDARTGTLSGGERQRVAIARALMQRPSVLLADEPTGNLDEATSEDVLRLIESINADGVTVIMVTHDPMTAARARRRILMRDGTIAEDIAQSEDALGRKANA